MAVKELNMSVRSSDATSKVFDFAASAADIKTVTGNVARELANYVSIPGFRKGRAPEAMVIKRYESDVKNEIMRKLISIAFTQIEEDKELDILNCTLAEPPAELVIGKDFSFALRADLAPEFSLPDYKAFKFDTAEAVITDAELEEKVEYYRNMYGSYADATGSAIADDMLEVSYTSDFALPEGASQGLARTVASDDNYIWLNEPESIPGAVKALIGAEPNKEYSFTAEFPADWRDAELAGKSVKYTVQVKGIKRREPATVESLCEKLQVKDITEFKDMLRTNTIREAEQKRRSEMMDNVYTELDSKIATFELNPEYVAAEAEKELRNIASSVVKTEEDAEKFKADIEKHKEDAKKQAEIRLRKMLIVRKIAKIEDIYVSDDELNAQLEMMSQYYGYKPADFSRMIDENGTREDLRADLLAAKVFNKLADYAEGGEKK